MQAAFLTRGWWLDKPRRSKCAFTHIDRRSLARNTSSVELLHKEGQFAMACDTIQK